ncbi:hypothetical protein GQX74_002868 [Glossina fuscipes]|nr:hypothetical protein GQX74_002868 [Glossina fuscipes]
MQLKILQSLLVRCSSTDSWCTTIIVLTFLIDSSRFRYPERAIVFLAVCYLVVGCAYVAGLGAGDSVACREPFPPPVRLGRLQMMSTITQGHRQSTACTVLFMALYFCCMAAFAWWSCLAFAWFLAAGLKWGHEAIENKSHLFHLVAWAIPALQTISVLALAKVEVCTWYEFVRGATASQTAWNINSVFGFGVTTHWFAIFRIDAEYLKIMLTQYVVSYNMKLRSSLMTNISLQRYLKKTFKVPVARTLIALCLSTREMQEPQHADMPHMAVSLKTIRRIS